MVSHKGVSAGVVATVVVVVGGVSWVGWQMYENAGNIPPQVPWLSVALLALVAGTVLRLGWTVRTYQRGRARHPLSPIRAARTLALAQASALTGAAVLGWYGAQLVTMLPDADLRAYGRLYVPLGAVLLAAVALLTAGMLTQSWCRVHPPDDEDDPRRDDPAH